MRNTKHQPIKGHIRHKVEYCIGASEFYRCLNMSDRLESSSFAISLKLIR